MSPRQQRRPLHFLLSLSFFYEPDQSKQKTGPIRTSWADFSSVLCVCVMYSSTFNETMQLNCYIILLLVRKHLNVLPSFIRQVQYFASKNMVLLEVTKIKYLYFPEKNFVSPNVLCSVNTVLAPLKTVYLSRIFRFLILSTI